jgi:hypothetical protein
VFDEGSLLDEVPYDEGITPEPVPEEVEDLKVRGVQECRGSLIHLLCSMCRLRSQCAGI